MLTGILYLFLLNFKRLIILKAIFKATAIRALTLSAVVVSAALQSGCQSMQFGASPIPVISYSAYAQP